MDILWIKALHVISVTAWMAGLLYLPRLYVYHTTAKTGSPTSELFKVMERRLLRAIMHPAAIASIFFGTLLIIRQPALLQEGWLHAKLACVVGLMAIHLLLERWRRHFAADANRHSQRFFRIVNEMPTLLMIAIVIFVIVRPF